MSQHDRGHEDALRRALHSAVDSIELSGEGLERIQARLTAPRPAPLAWVMAAPSEVARRARIGLSAVWAWLALVLARLVSVPVSLRSAWRRLAPGPPGRTHERGGAPRPGTPPRHLARARLVAAVAAAAFVLALSVSALTPFGRQMFADAAALVNSIAGGGSAGPGGSAASGPGNGAPGVTGTVGTGQGSLSPGQPTATCASQTPPLAAPRPSPSPSGTSPAASPSPSSTSPSSGPSRAGASRSTGPSQGTASGASASRASASSTDCESPGSSPKPTSRKQSPKPTTPSTSSPSTPSPSPSSTGPASPSPSPSTPAPSASSPGEASTAPSSPSASSPGEASTAPSSPSTSSPGQATNPGPSENLPASPGVPGSG